MNHYKIYDALCESRLNLKKERAISQNNGAYFEKHHIIPVCLGGTDEKSNIVLLTGREHYIAHTLLALHSIHNCDSDTKIKLLYAHYMMAGCPSSRKSKAKITSKKYESIRQELSREVSQKYAGKGNPMFGKKHSLETKNLIAAKATGRVIPQSQKHAISKALTGLLIGPKNPMYGKKHTTEHKEKLSKTLKEFFISPLGIEARKRMSKSHLEFYDTEQGHILKNILRISNTGNGNPRYGVVITKKTKRKISVAVKQKYLDPLHKNRTSKYKYKMIFPDGSIKENLYRCDVMKFLNLNRWEMQSNKYKIVCRGTNKGTIIEKYRISK